MNFHLKKNSKDLILGFAFLGILLNPDMLQAQNLTSTENYLFQRQYLQPVLNSTPTAKKMETVSYYDGLGRLKQEIEIGLTPLGKDLVTPVEYDAYGRQVKSFLPLPQAGTTQGSYYSAVPMATAIAAYDDSVLYQERKLESSPLGRLKEQAFEGSSWALNSNNTLKKSYELNTLEDKVKRFAVISSWSEGVTFSTLKIVSSSATQPTTYFSQGQLFKDKTTDPNQNERLEFKDSRGRLILARIVLGPSNFQDTYYIYNEYNNLAFVLSPQASKQVESLTFGATISLTLLADLATQYRYNSYFQLVEIKRPATGWEQFIYDNGNRLRFRQDEGLRSQGLWHFYKYDSNSRLVYEGLTPGGSRGSLASMLKQEFTFYESLNSTGFSSGGLTIYYSNNAMPIVGSSSSVNKVLYYDKYPLQSPQRPQYIVQSSQPTLSDQPTSFNVNGYSSNRSTKGLQTALFLRTLGSSSFEWTKSFFWYDTYSREISQHTYYNNGGYTKEDYLLDFSSSILEKHTAHKRLPTDLELVFEERFIYDNKNRLLSAFHKVGSKTEELLKTYSYDELSRVSHKRIGSATLQELNFRYNVRDWLLAVNDPNNLGSDLFAFSLRYQDPQGEGSEPLFNGNISQMDWAARTPLDSSVRRYSYFYDKSSRLISALYSKPQATNPNTGSYDETISYDSNGNILSLSRYGASDQAPRTKIDELSYTYQGNKITKVVDLSAQGALGYPIGGNLFSYDSSGRMTSLLDIGISSISYNELNLPKSLIHSGTTTSYQYRWNGEKTLQMAGTKTSEYLDGFHYLTVGGVTTLEFASHSEGYFDFKKNAYIYTYLDHLGNTRLSFWKNSAGVLEIIDENHYYPFGLKHEGYGHTPVPTPSYQYKFAGKELQNTGIYDFGARHYLPELGRWMTVDPLAEKYPAYSPYAYALNNPIRFIDPDGRMAVEFDTDLYNTDGKKIGTDGVDNGVKMVVTDKKEARQISKIKGNVDLNNVNSGVILPSDATLQESLNVSDRTIANGGLREESSIVMNDGTVIQGQTGSMPTIVNEVQTASASLPNLPAGTTPADAEAIIHSHPTTVQQVGNQIFPQSASTPSATDRGTFSQYNTNIIVGPLGTVKNATTNPNGTLNIPNRPNGAVIYDRNTTPQVELTRKAIQNILKN